VTYRKGSPVRLEELGSVIDSVEDDKTASWFYTPEETQRSIFWNSATAGTNTIEVINSVRDLIKKFRDEIPTSFIWTCSTNPLRNNSGIV